jgi:hypothetical protein
MTFGSSVFGPETRVTMLREEGRKWFRHGWREGMRSQQKVCLNWTLKKLFDIKCMYV